MITPEQYVDKLGFTDALGFGAIVLLQGMVTVFAVLCIIWGSLVIFKRVFTAFEKKQAETPVAAQPAAHPAVTESTNESDDEIIAVIAAAIAAAESETPGARFKVVSFKRV